MHGEYKVPNGKLVIADLQLDADHCISHASISGDFFLEPDSALNHINHALIGLPQRSSSEAIGQAIKQALSPDTQLIGFSHSDMVIALQRALGNASHWQDFTFDVIDALTLDAALHVALDEVLVESVASGQRNPTLRLWDWNDSVVVIGAFQSFKNEIDELAAKRHNTQVIRRITGGGAMFMQPGNCITYSLIVPSSLIEGMSFRQSYAYLDDWVLGALNELGVKAHYVPINDIASDKGKIGGAAQKRFNNGITLHHATMAYDIDATKMTDIIRIGREKLSDKGVVSANKRVDPMRSQTGLSRHTIMQAFLQYFSLRYSTQASQYSEQELRLARQLLKQKFLSDDWTYRIN